MKGIVIQIISSLSTLVYHGKGYNIVAYWPLNGTEQGLTLHGGPTFVEGRYPGSKAINFNQTDQCFARVPKVDFSGRSFTIAVWINLDSNAVGDLNVIYSDWYNPWQFNLAIHKTRGLRFVRHSSAQPWFNSLTTKAIEADTWTHVAVTWNQDTGIVKLFIDAKEEVSNVFSTATVWKLPTKDTYEIGDDGHWKNHQFLGSVMDLFVIEEALNSEQLKYLKGFPQITSSINNTVVYVNEKVLCQALGSPAPYVAWVRSGVVLVNKTSSAEINITDNGEYVCVASNIEGIEKLFVNAREQIQYKRSSINNTVVFTNETVTCEALGSPISYVAWVRFGVVLVNKTSSAVITITEDKGEYVCVISNREGIENLVVKAKAPLQLCHDHVIITDVSRAVTRVVQSSQVKTDATDIDLSKWYRIQSPAGNQLPTTCVPQNRCGTQAPGWLNGPHPSVQDGIVKRTVCFHFNGNCCYQNTTVHIRKCFGFYVYKFSAVPKRLQTARHCIANKQIDTKDIPLFTFSTTENSREALVGHVMYSESEVQKDLICLNYCIILVECKSFNYNKEKKICELNNATHQEYPEDIIKNDTTVYYQKLSYNFVNPP